MKDMLPDPEKVKNAHDYTLFDIYETDPYAGKVQVYYEYDQGDGWNHSIVFLGKADPSIRKALHIPEEMQVFCYAGQGHGVAEDSGGPGGWE